MKNHLTYVNMTREAFRPGPGHYRIDLHSSDGTVWTLENNLTEKEARARLTEFAEFSGLPSRLLGQEN